MRFQFRVTKYDPRFRDRRGVYTRDEWTSARDIGRTIGGVTLTAEEYERVETAYASTIVEMLAEAGVERLVVSGLEARDAARVPFGEGGAVSLTDVAEVARSVLREAYWCRLAGSGAGARARPLRRRVPVAVPDAS